MLTHFMHSLLDAQLWEMQAWGLPALAVMFLMHEGGHAILGAAAGSPIIGFGFSIFTGGRTWRWKAEDPWNPRNGEWQKRRFGWNPHVISYPYPSTGWVRMMKSGGGPLGSLLGVLLVLHLSGPTLMLAWKVSSIYILGAWVAEHSFQCALLILSFVGVLNIFPRRLATRFYGWVLGVLGFRGKRKVERWIFRRNRLVSDGDRFFSAITRHRRGRRWRRPAPVESYSFPES